MNRFSAFVLKEIRHILRDWRTLLILFGMPVAQVLIFGYALQNEIKNAGLAVLDPSNDPASIGLVEKLTASGYFIFQKKISSESEIEPAFQSGKVKLALVFPENFSEKIAHDGAAQVQFLADATDINAATVLLNYADAIVADFNQNLQKTTLNNSIPRISVETKMVFNPELKGVFLFIPGTMALILMLISAMMTSLTIAREKELGTMEILLISPLRPAQIIVGKAVPYLVLALIDAAVIVLLGVLVFGMPVRGPVWLLAVECFLFVMTALSLGLFISTKTDRQFTAFFVSALGLMMPTVLLSGFIFPIDSMPVPLQKISLALPARYFIEILRGVMVRGTGLAAILPQTLVLVAMTVFFLILSVKNFKSRLSD